MMLLRFRSIRLRRPWVWTAGTVGRNLCVAVSVAALGSGCFSSGTLDGEVTQAEDSGDAVDGAGPVCSVDLLFVRDVALYGSTPWIFPANFAEFDARLAVGGVSDYHLGSVPAVGGFAWRPEWDCPSYGLVSGELTPPGSAPDRTCVEEFGTSPAWAEGPGGNADEVARCLVYFGFADGPWSCYPFAEALKVAQLATSSPLLDGANRGMFRDDALLVVVFLIPRDDCSVVDPWVYEHPSEWPSPCGVDPAWADWLAPVEQTARHFEEFKDGRVAVALWGGADGAPVLVTRPDGHQEIERLCMRTDFVGATPSPRFHRFLESFGDRALFADWCEVESEPSPQRKA